MNNQRLIALLRAQMTKVGIGQKHLALKAGLNETAVRDILKGRSKNPKLSTLQALAQALNMDLQGFAAEINAVPVLATEPSASVGRAPRTGHRRPRNRLGELLVASGHDGKELSKRTKIPHKRLAAIANGAEVTQDELDRIAEALDLGVFDIFDFAPLTRDEAALVIDLRHISAEDRRNVQNYIDAMKLRAANDQKGTLSKPARKKSA